MNQQQAETIAAELIRFIETGVAADGLFSSRVFCDFTSPRWREQCEGIDSLVALRRRGHPGPSRVPRFRCDPTPTGFVLEIEEEWEGESKGEGETEAWYCRELFRADIAVGKIAAISVYCTGDWDRERRAEHAREVRLLRP